jgi:hypothetical protein
MSKNIYFVGGSKGGVGKSIVSMALANYLKESGEKVLLIDSDTSNPDVWKSYNSSYNCQLIDLDDGDGWVHLVNLCDANNDSVVVINSAARNTAGIVKYAETLNSTLAELNRKLTTLWVINRHRDSLELLKEYIGAMQNSKINVIRNSYFSEEKKFELYNNSNIRTAIEAKGGKSLTFPDLADRVTDDLYTNRMTIEAVLKESSIGNRAEIMRWRNEVKKVFDAIIVDEDEAAHE